MTDTDTPTTDRALRVLAALLVATVAFGPAVLAAPATASATDTQTSECPTVVTHDRFRFNNDSMTTIATGGQATSTVRNTQVRISEGDAFYRVSAENPNAYCVRYVVMIGETAIPPAELPGTVPSNSDEYEAEWDAIHDFNASETYTHVEFTLPAGASATFSPSQVRVVPLSWASKEPTKAQGAWKSIKDRFSDRVLAKNEYTLKPGREATMTVPLKNPDTGEEVTEYQAQYSTDGGDSWTPVGTDTEAPVYKRATDGAVQFTFTDPDARVKFVANPGVLDKAQYELDSYLSGWTNPFDDVWPFGALAPGNAAAPGGAA